jgi:mRNA interferase MazF
MCKAKIAITLDERIVGRLDRLVHQRAFANRSQAIEQAGTRPVLIIRHDVFNSRSGTVIAMALTSQPQRAGYPLTLELKMKELSKPTWVKISRIRTISGERIGGRSGE